MSALRELHLRLEHYQKALLSKLLFKAFNLEEAICREHRT
jgi:hypothetical protein